MMLRLAIELANKKKKAALLAPTLFLLLDKWRELQQILSSMPSPPRAILTAGAGQYCVFNYQVPQRFCSRCPLHRRHHALHLEGVAVTFEDIDKMVPEDVCGYWAQEEAMRQYDIIAGHYGRLPKISGINYLLIDEAHEFYLPHITSYAISDIAELLGRNAEELDGVSVIRELIAEKLNRLDLDAQTEDRLYSLSLALRKTCWIEAQELHCMDLYGELPRDVRILAATATPPPGWPPEGWGEKIEIEPTVKPRAYVEPEAKFYFKDRYEGATLQLHFIAQWLRENFGVQSIAVFAISSLRHVLTYSLPPGVELYPIGGLVDAWGKMRVGVGLTHDAVVVFWPSLHISARRRLRAENRDPDVIELTEGVQLAGRILRPRGPEERYEDVLRKRVVILADARFWHHKDYLQRFFDVLELRLPQ